MTDQVKHPCGNCGADLDYAPGKDVLECPYCGSETPIDVEEAREVEELDFHAHLAEAGGDADTEEAITVGCTACGAEVTFDETVTGDACPFCGTDITAEKHSTRTIKPRSLLPFGIQRDAAVEAFRGWVKRLWFAPNKLKAFGRLGKMTGVYVPFWTYDTATTTSYTGQRGEHYYVTEHYTAKDANGKTIHKTRRVRKTRWYPAHGTVGNSFDDLLVLGSHSLPRTHADALEPWDLQNLVPFSTQYLSGFRTERYAVDLEEGFGEAREKMKPTIRASVKRDIGGDCQRVFSMNTHYDDITFKHILLPVWISVYHFRDKPYRVLVNARTGEVRGERPYSVVKITLVVLGLLALTAVLAWLLAHR